MEKKSISYIIEHLKEVSGVISPANAELANKINQAIFDLQQIDKPSKTDKIIDRVKKISDILNPLLKILFDWISDQ